jgi:hypothetical protein
MGILGLFGNAFCFFSKKVKTSTNYAKFKILKTTFIFMLHHNYKTKKEKKQTLSKKIYQTNLKGCVS